MKRVFVSLNYSKSIKINIRRQDNHSINPSSLNYFEDCQIFGVLLLACLPALPPAWPTFQTACQPANQSACLPAKTKLWSQNWRNTKSSSARIKEVYQFKVFQYQSKFKKKIKKNLERNHIFKCFDQKFPFSLDFVSSLEYWRKTIY